MKKTILSFLFAALTLGAYASNCGTCKPAEKDKSACACGAKTAEECKQKCDDKCTKPCSEKPAEQPKKK